eukprot:scaffold9689_cov79-Skeletonema_dohrnii-CCMP3373.AAC.7
MLEPCQRCFYTIMVNYNGSLEAGHLRRCSDAGTANKCLSRVKHASMLRVTMCEGGSEFYLSDDWLKASNSGFDSSVNLEIRCSAGMRVVRLR